MPTGQKPISVSYHDGPKPPPFKRRGRKTRVIHIYHNSEWSPRKNPSFRGYVGANCRPAETEAHLGRSAPPVAGAL